MRISALLMLFIAITSHAADGLFVVVHTTDRIVMESMCGEDVISTKVLAPGRADWHATGGVAPYRVIERSNKDLGAYCITVMDATGATATGCGMITERRELVMGDCPEISCEPLETRAQCRDRLTKQAKPATRPRSYTPPARSRAVQEGGKLGGDEVGRRGNSSMEYTGSTYRGGGGGGSPDQGAVQQHRSTR